MLIKLLDKLIGNDLIKNEKEKLLRNLLYSIQPRVGKMEFSDLLVLVN